jgi:hypothetical protein
MIRDMLTRNGSRLLLKKYAKEFTISIIQEKHKQKMIKLNYIF